MSISLALPVQTYFHASNIHDSSQIADCFTSDGIVVDEGITYLGREAIKNWQGETNQKFQIWVEPFLTLP
jgi:hypothetical protein